MAKAVGDTSGRDLRDLRLDTRLPDIFDLRGGSTSARTLAAARTTAAAMSSSVNAHFSPRTQHSFSPHITATLRPLPPPQAATAPVPEGKVSSSLLPPTGAALPTVAAAAAAGATTLEQASVQQLIEALYHKSTVEALEPHTAPWESTEDRHGAGNIGLVESTAMRQDPHLRLRRTLTPSVGGGRPGADKVEASFLIEGSSGQRQSLGPFTWDGNEFVMDGYFWGASEAAATHRIVALHGVTPGISRTRWHALGERLTRENSNIRFCALDWHSIDRADKYQTAFLTMLPKYFGGCFVREGIAEGRHLECEAMLAKTYETAVLRKVGVVQATREQLQKRTRAGYVLGNQSPTQHTCRPSQSLIQPADRHLPFLPC